MTPSNPTDLQAGREAGHSASPAVPPPEIGDRAAYAKGLAEGQNEIEEMQRWYRARITTPTPRARGTGRPSGSGPG